MKMGKRIKVINVVGTRPNFIKIASIIKSMKEYPKRMESILVHTGQHYDKLMSKVFFDDLEIPKPDIDLDVGPGSHSEQTANIMLRFEKVLLRERPDLVLVVGDVNSTLACTITSAKLCIPVAHVEAGLRSFDHTMPEEINRIVTDSISNYLFTTCEDANENLKREGIPKNRIFFVGNVMIDTLLRYHSKAKQSKILEKLGLKRKAYMLLTLHRPSNVDLKENFIKITKATKSLSKDIPIIFAAHPRTRGQITQFGLEDTFKPIPRDTRIPNKGVWLTEPFGYLDFLNLMSNAKAVLTDSGGIQEETTILGVPCITIRKNTERPVTVREGTNVLVDTNTQHIIDEGIKILHGLNKPRRIPKLWDGKASKRIVKVLLHLYDEL